MLDLAQFRENVVRPVLMELQMHSDAAEALVLGTAMQESGLQWLRQLGGGPALGLFQMEPATHDDIWNNYLAFRPEIAARVERFLVPGRDRADQLVWNLAYATAMCRIHYRRVQAALPAATDVAGLAGYWKAHYNTAGGAGSEAEFAANFARGRIGSAIV